MSGKKLIKHVNKNLFNYITSSFSVAALIISYLSYEHSIRASEKAHDAVIVDLQDKLAAQSMKLNLYNKTTLCYEEIYENNIDEATKEQIDKMLEGFRKKVENFHKNAESYDDETIKKFHTELAKVEGYMHSDYLEGIRNIKKRLTPEQIDVADKTCMGSEVLAL